MIERHMVAAQRLIEYIDMPVEPALREGPGAKKSGAFQARGAVEFRNVSLRYSETSHCNPPRSGTMEGGRNSASDCSYDALRTH